MAQLHGYFPTVACYVCVFDDALVAVPRVKGADKKRLGFLKRMGGERESDVEAESQIRAAADLTSSEFADSLGGEGDSHGFGRVSLGEIEGIEIGPPERSLEWCDVELRTANGGKWTSRMEEEARNRAANLLTPVVGDRLVNRWDEPLR